MLSELKFLPLVVLFLAITPLMSVDVSISLYDGAFTINNRQFVQAGFPDLPSSYTGNQTDAYLFYTLQLGAQFVAAQAVTQGLFSTSACDVVRVYSSSVSEPVQDPVIDPEGDISLAGHHYYFDMELESDASENIRAQFVVLMNEYTYSFQVSWYKFDYVVSYNGHLTEVELGFADDNYEYNVLDWDTESEGSYSNAADIPVVEELPELGESFDYDPNLPINDWVEVDINDRVNNDDFIYLLRYGVRYSINQAYRTGDYAIDNSTQFTVTNIHSVWEKNGTSRTDFKFDAEAYSVNNQTFRCNFQVWYNPSASTMNFYAWAIETMIDPILDY